MSSSLHPVAKKVQALLLQGYTQQDIQDLLDLTAATYDAMVARITRQAFDAEFAQRVLDLELQRLDEMQRVFYLKAVEGSHADLAAMLSIMKRRAAYLGLDAPVQVAHTQDSFVDMLASLSQHPLNPSKEDTPYVEYPHGRQLN